MSNLKIKLSEKDQVALQDFKDLKDELKANLEDLNFFKTIYPSEEAESAVSALGICIEFLDSVKLPGGYLLVTIVDSGCCVCLTC